MSDKLTVNELNKLPKEEVISMLIAMQDQVGKLNSKLDYLTEQIAIANNYRFGRKSEKSDQISHQGTFDSEGNIYFNEAEAINDKNPDPDENGKSTKERKHTSRTQGKKDEDLSAFPVYVEPTYDVPEEELIREFGSLDNCRRMNDVVSRRLMYVPAGWKVIESHVAVYRSRKGSGKFVKGKGPAYLLRSSYVTPSLEAAIINAKYANALPFRRIEKDFAQFGANISEQNMASWTIKCADRYLSRLYEYLKKKMKSYHVLQVDETTVEVAKDGRSAGRNSYMWVYRTGKYYKNKPIVIYDYQMTRRQSHPIEFLEGFNGYLTCDGYAVYNNVQRDSKEDIIVCGCWCHGRRRFADAVKAVSNNKNASLPVTIASEALKKIARISHEEGKLQEMPPKKRLKARNEKVRPLVDDFFAWAKEKNADNTILMSAKTKEGLNYCINQERKLRMFLEDGEIPMDNNSAESTIRPFTIGRRNWMVIDTISGAKSSAIIYSLVETAKANTLNIYYYFNHLLTELSKLKEFTSDEEEAMEMEKLLPWSKELPDICHKRGR